MVQVNHTQQADRRKVEPRTAKYSCCTPHAPNFKNWLKSVGVISRILIYISIINFFLDINKKKHIESGPHLKLANRGVGAQANSI